MTTESKADRLNKSTFLVHWLHLKPNQPLNPAPMRYKHSGSSYGEDGIRITGSRDFIDSVLSRIKDLIEFENDDTRLDVNYSEQCGKSKDADGRPVFHKEGTGQWVCYIKVAERGLESRMANAMLKAFN